MKMMSRLLAAVLALLLCIMPVLSMAEQATSASPEDLMVLVNGEPISRADLSTYTSYLENYFSQYGYDVSSEEMQKQLTAMAVEMAVQYKLMDQKAADMGLDQYTEEELAATKAEVSEEWNNIVEMYTQYYGGVTEESTEEELAAARVSMLAMLEAMGYTEDVLLAEALDGLKYTKLQNEIVKDVEVTDAEVLQYYQSLVDEDKETYQDDVGYYEYMTQYYGQSSYYVPEGYRGVTHILLAVDEEQLQNYQDLLAKLEEADEDATETVTQADVDAAYAAIMASVQPTIEEINKKLADGAAFADLIAEYGTDPGMASEPYKTEGYPVHKDSIIWDPVFTAAAFSVENVGDVAEPVLGSYGVHIVYYLRDIPSGAVELTDELRNELREVELESKMNDKFTETMNAWVEEAEIVYSALLLDMMPTAE